MICQILAVPPPSVRPSVKHDAQQRSEDDISHIIVNIIKANTTLAEKISKNHAAKVIEDWTTVLQYYIATMVDNKIPGVASVAQRSGRPLKAIKDRLNQLQSTTSTKDNFWKPAPGKTQIRIVPYKHNKENPFIELFFHYNLGNNKTYLSPLSFGRPDPVAEFADKLKSTGNKDEWIQGKRLEPKMRTFAPVIVRGKESEGVKFWGFGKTVYQELLGVIADPDYGDITDATNGRDIGIERQTPAEAGNQYGKTTVRVKPNQTAITEDAALLTSIMAVSYTHLTLPTNREV